MAGAVGFAKWQTNNEVLDNFSWTNLASSPSNPVPVTTDLSPATATGRRARVHPHRERQRVRQWVRGAWNGAARITTYVSPTQVARRFPRQISRRPERRR